MGFTPFGSDVTTNVLAGISSLCWLSLYVVACWRGIKEKTFLIPMAAVALNITWEFLFGFVWTPTEPYYNVLQMWINRAWCVMDVVILATCFMYGPASAQRALWRGFTLLAVAAAVAVLGSFYYVSDTAEHQLIQFQAVSAFVMNVVMSVLFIQSRLSNWLRRSLVIAGSKWIGTAAITLVYFLPTDSPHTDYYPVIQACGVACFFLDGYFTYLTVKP